MDESTADMHGKAKRPQHQQNDDDCPEHFAPVSKVAATFGNKRAKYTEGEPMNDTLTVYEKPTCSTCRNLVKLLQERGIEFERVNYIIDPIPRAKLADLAKKMRGRPHEMLRAKEQAFKDLNRPADSLSDDEVLDLLARHPELVQRPIVERGDRAVVARPVERVDEVFE
jgi:arsenate reductase